MRRLAVLSAAAWLAVPARADSKREIGLTIGQAIMIGDEADKMTDSPSITLFWYKRLSLWITGGVDLGQTLGHKLRGRLSEKELGDVDGDGKADSADFTSGAKVTVLWLSPIMRIGLADEDIYENLRPYGIVGVGYYQTKRKAGTASLFGKGSAGADFNGASFPLAKSEENNIGLNLGGGFTLRLSNRFELAGDLRYHYVFTHKDTLNLLIPSARFNFLF